ncbi:MAG: S8 family serine peptidase [Dehalococcoidia bacterium]|nr:S8 family serine peptidase [Dehalococcoidia bacterium]
MKKRILLAAATMAPLLVFLMALAGRASLTAAQTGDDAHPQATARVAPAVESALRALPPDGMISVIVTLREQADLDQVKSANRPARLREVERRLKDKAAATQRGLKGLLLARALQGKVARATDFWVFNGLAVTATKDVIEELAARPEVASITPDEIDVVPASPAAAGEPEPNVALVNAPALWALGWRGQGIVVANMDTGVDVNHPDLISKWRGGTNSWYDPYGQHPTSPADLSGHGTWTMGVMVGGDAGGTAIGVAPEATWVAVKIFNDQGSATATAIHQGFQWLLDPDGNPGTADAPHVVNNSWSYGSPGCSLEFQLDLQALLAAGIVPVFAGGNYGPNASSSVSPANNPEAFAVGAVDDNRLLYASSSRGPSACGEQTSIYPEVVAPGVNIRTTDRYGLYYDATGTSVAAPHVAGALALLLDAYPGLTAEQQRQALLNGAADLGDAGPDNIYGYGLPDVYASYKWLSSPPGATPTPVPIPSVIPDPTATPPPPTATPVVDPVFADGFESGNFSAWTSAETNGGDLSVSAEAAIFGTKGMQAATSGTAAMYVTDGSPAAETSYHARFYFNPNGALTGNNQQQTIFAGFNAAGTNIFSVEYRRQNARGGTYQVRATVARAGGTSTTSWFTIANNTPHSIEIAWQSGASVPFRFYVDGSFRQSLNNLNTSAYLLDFVRLGPQAGLTASASGTQYFDAFVSTRFTHIGP